MKLKHLIIVFLVLFGTFAQGQIKWVHDLTMAKALAVNQGKLLVIDFWATWCGPCQTMDKELWNTEKTKKFMDNAIFVRVDIDQDEDIATRFRVKGIPDVRIIDVAENSYWSQSGYRNESPFILAFEQIPTNILNLNEYLLLSANEEATAIDHQNTAKALIFLAKRLENIDWKKEMYYQSCNYLRQSRKLKKELRSENELLEYVGLCIIGKADKAMNKLDKINFEDLKEKEQEIYAMVEALYYLDKRNKDGFLSSFSKVKDPFYQSLLR